MLVNKRKSDRRSRSHDRRVDNRLKYYSAGEGYCTRLHVALTQEDCAELRRAAPESCGDCLGLIMEKRSGQRRTDEESSKI